MSEDEDAGAYWPLATDFTTPLDPMAFAHDTVRECTRILQAASVKYPWASKELALPINIRAMMFYTIYFAVTDDVLAALTKATYPHFHFWLTAYHHAFITTQHPYGFDVQQYVDEVRALVELRVYLPKTAYPEAAEMM